MSTFAGTTVANCNPADFAQIPVALGGAVVVYNLNGITNLKLTANVIAAIYNGTITYWDDANIKALNKTVNLPHTAIVVEYRAKSSGTTYAFTDYLAKASAGHTPTGASGAVLEGTGAKWGATNINAVSNNAGMATSVNSTPGAIGYLEYSYVLTPGNHIQVASLQDAAGEWLTPSLKNIAAAAAAAVKTITTDNFSITYQPGKGVWPFATYTWAIVKLDQSANAAKGEAAVKFLDYVINGGQMYANANGFVALPATVVKAAHATLLTVKAGKTVLLSAKN
jgi:phosphate transport system substrate-binding protein